MTYYYSNKLEHDFKFPDCILVPGFDSLILGYRDRSRMMDEKNYRKVTNVSGIICPTIIVRKKIRAGWKYSNNLVEITPFEKLSASDILKIRRKIKNIFGRKVRIALKDSTNGWISL